MTIDGRAIGPGHPPFIIAELSANHGGDLERALRIIRQAAAAGADAVKFQAYTADSLTLDHSGPGFVIDSDNPWTGERLYDLYRRAATPYEWFPTLFAATREAGLIPFASPFDADAVAMLETLDAPAHKIASFEAVDTELIACCAATGKPLIISTGMSNADEVADALAAVHEAGGTQVVLLKCTSAYPADAREANLRTIPEMARRFGVPVGLSDHTMGTAVSAAACALGACAIEKHVIDAREPETADSIFSLLPDDLARLVADCRDAAAALGTVHFGPGERERQSLAFRRSLYAVRPIAAGEAISRDNVRSIRPGFGLPVKTLRQLVGRRARAAIAAGTPMSWDLVE
ncbi:MAG: pseudaminic acid synthase [Rhodospirillaceae bacterium]|nr:pseudaminic acid synthase [Rhodospirillaceae bacterium]